MDFRDLKTQRSLFECCLCLNIIQDPYDCIGCGLMFCHGCLVYYLNDHAFCPNQCQFEGFKSLDPAFTSLMNRITAQCKHSDCNFRCALTSLRAHERRYSHRILDDLSGHQIDEIKKERDADWINAVTKQYTDNIIELLSPQSGRFTPKANNRFTF